MRSRRVTDSPRTAAGAFHGALLGIELIDAFEAGDGFAEDRVKFSAQGGKTVELLPASFSLLPGESLQVFDFGQQTGFAGGQRGDLAPGGGQGLIGPVLHVAQVHSLGLQFGKDLGEVGGLVQFLIGQRLGGGEQFLRVGQFRSEFVAPVLEFHDAHLRQDQLLAHAMQEFSRLRWGGLHGRWPSSRATGGM